MLTIREFGDFHKDALKILGQETYEELITYLAIHPESGDIMPHTGGFRKLRWKREGTGKSGGARVIYYFYNENNPLSLVLIYAKSKQEALTKEQQHILYEIAQDIKKGH